MCQGDAPDWSPLLDAVNEEFVGDFMWMFEVTLSDGTSLQAYKHIHTRRYLHLAPGGAEFAFEPPHSYRALPSADLAAIARLWRDWRPRYT
jgi:hypothetical protein